MLRNRFSKRSLGLLAFACAPTAVESSAMRYLWNTFEKMNK